MTEYMQTFLFYKDNIAECEFIKYSILNIEYF